MWLWRWISLLWKPACFIWTGSPSLFLNYANPLHMSIFLLPPHPIYNCPVCDEAMSEVPEGKLLNWERRKHIFIHECFQVLPSLLSPSASLPFFPSGIEHAASRFGLVGFFVCFFFFLLPKGSVWDWGMPGSPEEEDKEGVGDSVGLSRKKAGLASSSFPLHLLLTTSSPLFTTF